MGRTITISSGLIRIGGRARSAPQPGEVAPRHPLRSVAVGVVVAAAFASVGGQLVRLAMQHRDDPRVSISTPMASGVARPDLVDRNGRLLASDVEMPSLYADPMMIVDRDETVEKLRRLFPDLDDAALLKSLGDRSRRFEWIRRGLAPALAQKVHNLGLPGLDFQAELRRAYPAGRLAGHVLGGVNIDNRAVAGIEQHLDAAGLVDPAYGAQPSTRPPVALSLDLSVQHALENELADAVRTYRAKGAGGVVLDVETGEVLASASLPRIDPARPDATPRPDEIDRISAGTYELGSIFKLMTVALALDSGAASADTLIDVSEPLVAGRFKIKDHHSGGGQLSVRDVFLKSSNVGAGQLALQAGPERQRAFLETLALTGRMATEAGPIAQPLLPRTWGEIETITIGFGHGMAVAPLQFAAAAAALVNGGQYVAPTFLKRPAGAAIERRRVVSPETSATLRAIMRANVAERGGTGRRAAVPGYDVGGKTGTAEIAINGRYDRNAVIASFLGAFPMSKPRYLTLVMVFKPSRTKASGGEITASHTAAPVTRRLISRIAPLLGVSPQGAVAGG